MTREEVCKSNSTFFGSKTIPLRGDESFFQRKNVFSFFSSFKGQSLN